MKTDTKGSTTDNEMMTGCLRLSRKIFLKIVESFTGSGENLNNIRYPRERCTAIKLP